MTGSGNWNLNTTVKFGSSTFSFIARDLAGNISAPLLLTVYTNDFIKPGGAAIVSGAGMTAPITSVNTLQAVSVAPFMGARVSTNKLVMGAPGMSAEHGP